MSWVYEYFCVYKNKKENKLYFLGPYNHKGEIMEVISRSRSFASDLYEFFDKTVDMPMYSDKMLSDLQRMWGLDDEEMQDKINNDKIDWRLISYRSLDELPTDTNYIKEGYFLNEDIAEYEKEHDYESMRYSLSASEYTRMMQNELKFGKPGEKINDWGEKYIPHSCEDYSFYRYPDYGSIEYEMSEIKHMINILTDDGATFWLRTENNGHYYDPDPNIELGVLLMQG